MNERNFLQPHKKIYEKTPASLILDGTRLNDFTSKTRNEAVRLAFATSV